MTKTCSCGQVWCKRIFAGIAHFDCKRCGAHKEQRTRVSELLMTVNHVEGAKVGCKVTDGENVFIVKNINKDTMLVRSTHRVKVMAVHHVKLWCPGTVGNMQKEK